MFQTYYTILTHKFTQSNQAQNEAYREEHAWFDFVLVTSIAVSEYYGPSKWGTHNKWIAPRSGIGVAKFVTFGMAGSELICIGNTHLEVCWTSPKKEVPN